MLTIIDGIECGDAYDPILTAIVYRSLFFDDLTSIPKEVGNLTSLSKLYVDND